MSFVARFERRLEGLVNATFARLFRSEVKPVEIRSALEHELDNNAQVLRRDSALAPNEFVVELSPTDHTRLAGYGTTLSDDLARAVVEHADVEHYLLPGAVEVDLRPADDLSTGRFRVSSRAVSSGSQRRSAGAPSAPPVPSPSVPSPGLAPAPPAFAPIQRRTADWNPQLASPQPTPPATPPRPAPVAGSAARLQTPWLEVNGTKHELPPPGVLVGRGSDADLQIVDPGVSRRHAEIRVAFIGRRYTVTLHDLGSTNGTLVNGERVGFGTLAEGSTVTVGNSVLTVHIPSPPRV